MSLTRINQCHNTNNSRCHCTYMSVNVTTQMSVDVTTHIWQSLFKRMQISPPARPPALPPRAPPPPPPPPPACPPAAHPPGPAWPLSPDGVFLLCDQREVAFLRASEDLVECEGEFAVDAVAAVGRQLVHVGGRRSGAGRVHTAHTLTHNNNTFVKCSQ